MHLLQQGIALRVKPRLTHVNHTFTVVDQMIASFRHKGLAELFETGRSRRVEAALHGRALRRLDALAAATKPEDLNVPGFDFHRLQGKPVRYTVHVNGPWCITFGWVGSDAVQVHLEQYH